MDKKNIKKILIEVVLIPLCIGYIFYEIFKNHPKISLIACIILVMVTCIVKIVKYIKEVYIYEYKYNYLKIIYIIFCMTLIIVSILSLIITDTVFKIFIVMTSLLLIIIGVYAIKNLIDIAKKKGIIYKKTFSCYLNLIAFLTIIVTLIISII